METIGLLRDAQTIELFYYNARQAIFKVCLHMYFSLTIAYYIAFVDLSTYLRMNHHIYVIEIFVLASWLEVSKGMISVKYFAISHFKYTFTLITLFLIALHCFIIIDMF